MTQLEVIRNEMELLDLEERMVVDMNDWMRRIRVWDRIEIFYVLVHVADPKYIGIKACWFGKDKVSFKRWIMKRHRSFLSNF